MDITQARLQFPALKQKVFLDAACVSLAPQSAVDAIKEFLNSAALCNERSSTLHHIAMDDARSQARPEAARLINADTDEIAIVESTTQGLTIAANAIPLERGDRVVVSDLEFMQLAIPWVQKRTNPGIEIDVVPNRDGKLEVEEIASRFTARTKVVAVSSVQWSNGYRLDLDQLSHLCRERNVWLVVDAIQQLGAAPINVKETPVDFLVCGGHKWLNSPFGAGFMYIGKRRIQELTAPLAGYLAVNPPDGGWGAYFQNPENVPVKDYEFIRGAQRFETGGTANYPGAIGLAASLKLINDIGQDVISDHIGRLTEKLISNIDIHGLEVVTPADRQRRAGIVTFSAGDADENVRLMEKLLQKNILVSVRYTSGIGGIRVSCHFYNSEQDIDALLGAL